MSFLNTHEVFNLYRVMNNIKKPSEINLGANYHLFKKGIKPMWEESENRNGGKWTFSQRASKQRGPELDKLWLNTVYLAFWHHYGIVVL